MNTCAEMIKDSVHTGWRGYRIRASMKDYLQKMKKLQSGMRNCIALRKHIREHILLPMVWEAETIILGEVVGMPHSVMEHELDVHRRAWDPKLRFIEARQMSHARYNWANKTGNTGRRKSDASDMPSAATAFPGAKKLCSRTSRGRNSSLEKGPNRIAHPMMGLINQYRLSKDLRREVVEATLRENLDRWFLKYREYKEEGIRFQKNWANWRLEVQALGLANRSMWPPCPIFPIFPYELVKVDPKVLQARVKAALKRTAAGQLL